ncbi:SPOR domain-containing protein [Paenibacillus athensensis]|uniref:SPOR domain-containing protein n=1 Tax=Paenibacillus athensensis TaxID=1967502 RepID=A0A4Y8PV22_9BACL|nr:SPOR domain-containing protein [Paenibacillus athensensis]MCD1258201.1 SPOR domain-containing protein [Paenibacillus athensensis]
MSKARITYRFDQDRQEHGGRRTGAAKGERVIPLYADEYSVKEDSAPSRADESGADERSAGDVEPWRESDLRQDGRKFGAKEVKAAGRGAVPAQSGRGTVEAHMERNAKRREQPHEQQRGEQEAWPTADLDESSTRRYTSLFGPDDFQSFTSEYGGWSAPVEAESESDRVERAIRESRSGRSLDGGAGKSELTGQTGSAGTVGRAGAAGSTEFAGYGGAPGVDKDGRESGPWSGGWGDERGVWTNRGGRDEQEGRGPWFEPETGVRYARSGRTPWVRIATSIAGAVVTGVAFGFFVLSLFSGGDQPSGDSGAVKQAAVQTSAATDGSGATAGNAAGGAAAVGTGAAAGSDGAGKADVAGAAAGAGAGGPAVPAQIAAQSYAFLQNGVFSTLASAQAAQTELKRKGLASALEQSDKLTVFVGFAQSRDDALALSQQLQDKQLEVYIKSVDIPAAAQIRWSGSKPEAVGALVGDAGKLVQTISGLTVVHLAESSPTSIDDASMQAIRAAHQALTKQAAAAGEGMSEDVKPFVQQMTTAASSAVQSMEEYKKNPSAAMLWQAQSSMMQLILAEKALMKQIAL